MKRFENLIAYIPHNDSDKTVMHWCGALARKAQSQKVDLLICYEDFYSGLQESPLNWTDFFAVEKARLEELASHYLMGVNYEISVINEAPAIAMLSKLSSGNYDLLVMPKETIYGINLVERLARKSPVGILVLPADAEPTIESIMVGVDFSGLSPLSIEWAEAFAQNAEGTAQLNAVHVMQMPAQSRALQATDSESIRSSLNSASQSMLKKLIQDESSDPNRWNLHVRESRSVAMHLVDEVKAMKTDLLVMGSQGSNALSIALLGGTASDLIRHTPIPLLIVKKKNESLGFLKQLLGLGQ